jgi:spore coat polysaccharide biosynthesis protein SpsF (cytidylyltransferase family)
VLKKINGVSMLSLVIRRVALSRSFGKPRIVVATTSKAEDKRVIEIAKAEGVGVFAGEEKDVLERYYQAAKKYSADIILRITSDCPLIDHEIIDKVTQTFIKTKGLDYCSNRLQPSYPEGLDTEIFRFCALEQAKTQTTDPYDREHVTPYLYRSGKFKTKNVFFKEDLSYLHLSVDEQADFEFVKEVYRKLRDKECDFVLKDILNIFMEDPDILKINQSQKARTKFNQRALNYKRKNK